MDCPFSDNPPLCDFVLEYEVRTEELREADELCAALKNEIDVLRLRIHDLEDYIAVMGLPALP